MQLSNYIFKIHSERFIFMGSYLPGIFTPHRKGTREQAVARIENVQTVTIPMSMHIGKPAKPVVKVGDLVKVGTKIGEADGRISSDIYASVSGKVVRLADFLLSNGAATTAVVIESDGEMTKEDVSAPVVNSREDFIAAVKQSGVVGLGGAGFPTHVKLDVPAEKIDYLLINGAECEPYITSDSVTMLTRGDDIRFALQSFNRWLGAKNIIIGLEKSNKKVIAAMQQLAASVKDFSVIVKVLPDKYPQGGEKVLVYHATGRKIPAGKLPIDVGCVVLNSTSVAAIGSFLQTGMPLVNKCITVEGGAVRQPQNVIAPVGTALKELFEVCGGFTEDPVKILYGGPMMGITVPNADVPVIKNTNAVLALTKKEAKQPNETACIRCGACVNTCPFSLAPVSIAEAYEKEDAEMLNALCVNTCMECGCCSFVCPANRPLVQINKLSKKLVMENAKKEGNKS